ncbi:MAG: hypothetical protein RL482_36, partial [Actinomycetota bacterium]
NARYREVLASMQQTKGDTAKVEAK